MSHNTLCRKHLPKIYPVTVKHANNIIIFFSGDFPYPSKSDRELLKCLVSGERLEKPSNCTDEM